MKEINGGEAFGGNFGTQAVLQSYTAGWMLKASEKDMRACDQFSELPYKSQLTAQKNLMEIIKWRKKHNVFIQTKKDKVFLNTL